MKLRTLPPRFRPLATLAALAVAAAAPAQSYYWNGGVSYNWGGAFNPSNPVPSTTTDLFFGRNANGDAVHDDDGLTNNDLADSFLLHSLNFANQAWTLTGRSLRFTDGGTIASTGYANSVTNAISLDGALTASVASSTLTLTGVISDTSAAVSGTTNVGSLVKTGAGTLVLGATNAYSGGTTIAAGTVQAGADDALGTGDLTLAGGTLDLNGHTVGVKDLNLGNGSATSVGTVSGAGTLNLNGNVTFKGAPPVKTASARLSANLSLSAGGHTFGYNGTYSSGAYDAVLSGAISGAGGLTKTGSDFNLALTGHSTYLGATNVGGGSLYLGATNALPTATALAVASGATLYLNPNNPSGGVTVGSYDQTVGSLAGMGTVSLGSAALTVGDATDTTFSGVISGAGGSLVKRGAGTLTLSGANAYSGGTTIAAGTVQAGADDALGTGDLTLAGGTLDLNGHSVTVKDLNLGDESARSVGTVSGAGTLNLNGNATFKGASYGTAPARLSANLSLSAGGHTFGYNGTFSSGFYDAVLSGAISGAGGLTKTGGTFILALTGHSTYAGATNVSAGGLDLGAANALPTATALAVAFGATLSLNPGSSSGGVTAGNYAQTVGSLTGMGTVSLGSAALTVGDATDTTFSGVISGVGGSLVKQGTGTLTLSSVSIYSGGTTVNAGVLALGATNPLPTSGPVALGAAGTLSLGGFDGTIGALTGTGTASLGTNALKVGNGDGSGAFAGRLTGSGLFDKVGAGREDVSGANLTGFTGKILLDAGTLATTTAMANSGPLTLNGGTLEVVENAAGKLTRTLSTGLGFAKSGTGTLKVGDQAISGTTVVTGGGLTFLSGSTYVSNGGFSVAGGATVTLGSFDTTLSGATFANAGTLRGTGEVDATLTNAGSVVLGNNDALTVGQGANANSGTMTASGGTLTVDGTLANSGTLSATGGVVHATGAVADTGRVSGHGSFVFDGGLAVTGAGSLAASGSTTDVFGSVAIGAPAARSGSVFSSGGGVLTFHGGVVNNAAQFVTGAGSSTVFLGLASGAGSFTGAGRVEFDGGYHPGNSPARVQFDNPVTFGAADTLQLELGGTMGGTDADPTTQYDQLSFHSGATLDGALDVVDYGGFMAGEGQSFDLFDGTLAGTFSSVSLPALASGLSWDTSMLYTTGVIRVTPQAVPEPAAWAVLGVGALGLLRRRRK